MRAPFISLPVSDLSIRQCIEADRRDEEQGRPVAFLKRIAPAIPIDPRFARTTDWWAVSVLLKEYLSCA